MEKIRIISASAGSGKTYRLTELLHQAVSEEDDHLVRPEAVVATTFTVKAAGELKERVRHRLIKEGMIEAARRLGAARMGTIHSVCHGLINQFALDLGLPPELNVIDEEATATELERALAATAGEGDFETLEAISQRLKVDWHQEVKQILDQARANGLGPEEIRAMATENRESVLGFLGQPAPNGDELDANLQQDLAEFLDQVNASDDTTRKTSTAKGVCHRCLGVLKAGRKLNWSDWVKLEKLDVARKSESLAAGVRAAAAAHDHHPALRADLAEAVDRLHELAARTMTAYTQRKAEWGVLDFGDLEAKTLTLLNDPVIRNQLAPEIDLILVDEFQDVSPIQLAILLKLAELAGGSIWVGDQKQSIYGFRDADPALMDACMKKLLRKHSPETLPYSWRSRPELVRATSDIFAAAFAGYGLAEELVRLDMPPDGPAEPVGLGPVFERWVIPGQRNNQVRDSALATGILELVNDPEVRIRELKTGQARQVRPGDIAVLCRTNSTAEHLANQLATLGIPSVLPRQGLLNTPEARVALAGLRLWVDAKDSLAAAELARLIHYPDKAGEWIERLLDRPGAEAFGDLPEIASIIKVAEANPLAGPLKALDLISETGRIRELCLAWGEADARLANLDRLRAHAAEFAKLRADGGGTVAGLAAHLERLREEELDHRALVASRDAVNLLTWHKAKGLEWPVTILYELDKTYPGKALGVKALSRGEEFNPAKPLADRWIRVWPFPYHDRNTNTPFQQRLANHPAEIEAQERERHQELRLLYVGWTRARDRLILAGPEGQLNLGILATLTGPDGPLLTEPEDGRVVWASREVEVKIRQLAGREPLPTPLNPGWDFVPPGPQDYPPARIVASALAGQAKAAEVTEIGTPLILGSGVNISSLAKALHAFMAADREELDSADRLALAREILHRWDIHVGVDPADLVTAVSNLRAWAQARLPGAEWLREWPLTYRKPTGTIVAGFADLILRNKDGFVLVDHKCLATNREEAIKLAESYGGQQAAYVEGITQASGLALLGAYIHLPLSGLVVRLEI